MWWCWQAKLNSVFLIRAADKYSSHRDQREQAVTFASPGERPPLWGSSYTCSPYLCLQHPMFWSEHCPDALLWGEPSLSRTQGWQRHGAEWGRSLCTTERKTEREEKFQKGGFQWAELTAMDHSRKPRRVSPVSLICWEKHWVEK